MKCEQSMDNVKRAETALLCMQRHSWEQGCAMQAFLEMGRTELVTAMAVEAANRITQDGRVATIGVSDGITDPCSCGEAMLYVSRRKSYKQVQAAVEKLLEWAVCKAPRNAEGIVYHLTRTQEFWADSFYMLPPFLAAAGEYQKALTNLNGYWNYLHDPKTGLIHHKWDDEKKTFSRSMFWGSGSGWALAGIARVIALLPVEYDKERTALIQKEKSLLSAVQQYQLTDGSFRNILDQTESFPEVNLSQMFAYTIYRGVFEGWLDDEFLPAADRARNAAISSMDDAGFIRNVCGAPRFSCPGISPEAQAFYLMMETAHASVFEMMNI